MGRGFRYEWMKGLSFVFLLVFTIIPGAQACLWDEDSLRMEAQGLPETAAVLTGWFERNPPRYYEMRLTRSAAEIEKNPDHLEAYDNAGVAADRLGRGEEALAWMDRKHQRLERMDPAAERTREHRYRYLANRGTFLVHHWLRQGAKVENLSTLAQSRDMIAEAVALNPDAHFGRERYQLAAMTWLLMALEGKTEAAETPPEYRSLLTFVENYPKQTSSKWNQVQNGCSTISAWFAMAV